MRRMKCLNLIQILITQLTEKKKERIEYFRLLRKFNIKTLRDRIKGSSDERPPLRLRTSYSLKSPTITAPIITDATNEPSPSLPSQPTLSTTPPSPPLKT